MPAQTLSLKIVADAAGADSVLKKCTQSLKELGITAGNFEVNTMGAASSITSLGGAMRNAGVETYNNQLGMTCQKVFGVSLAVNAVTGAFKSMVGQWRHALDVHLELVAAERLLNVATEDGAAAFDWVKKAAAAPRRSPA
jgi:hypothetical protein